MDFTREPIIETIISAKEGHKLLVRSSKMSGSEEYNVDAVEVVSFGSVQFFRAQEKPRPFLVPVTDYELLEVREMRLPIKNATHERTIKIAPKKESGRSKSKKSESKPAAKAPNAEESASEEGELKKKRTRRRTRRKKGEEEGAVDESSEAQVEKAPEAKAEEAPVRRKPLVPPPTTLISETISRYKDILLSEEKEEKKPPALPKELMEEEGAKSE